MPQHIEILRVRFVDTDASQRIHYTAMFRYFEVAENELLRARGVAYRELEASPLGYPRISVNCEYRVPLHFDDVLAVTARVERVGTTSFSIGFVARRITDDAAEETDAARGTITVVCIEKATGKAHPLPDFVRAALSD